MKRIIVASIVAVMTLPSCKNSENKTSDIDSKKNDELVVLESKTVVEEPNPSDASFIYAVDDYKKKDYAAAADQIEWGVLKIIQEEKPTEMAGDDLLMDMKIQNLRSLEDEVRNNKVDDIDDLTQAMVNAEMLVAHDYMVYTIASLSDEPMKSTTYFDKAVHAIDNAVVKLNGEGKVEAEKIRDESRELKDKMKSGIKVSEKDLKVEVNKIENFLKAHKSKRV